MRLLRHLFARSARSVYPEASLQRIADAVHAAEQRHTGEICFAVEASLPPLAVLRGVDAQHRAQQVFAQLRVWDTHANNGVLVYLLLADRRIEIVADRGLAGRVSEAQWRGVCQLMEGALAGGEHVDAVVAGIEAIGDLLASHYPREPGDGDIDELPNRPVML